MLSLINNKKSINKTMYKQLVQLFFLSIYCLVFIQNNYKSLASDIKGNKAPKIEFVGGNTYDWGKVKRNEGPLKAKIQVKNVGNDDLKIHSVKPGCGCTTAPISKELLKPGEIATIDVTLNISKQSGKVNKGIAITSNDPTNDKVNYMLKAEVEVPMTVFPKTLNFGNFDEGKETIAKIVLSNNTDKKIKVLGLNGLGDIKLNIKEGSVLNPKENFAIEAKYTAKQSGVLNQKITIINDSEDGEISFQAVGTIYEAPKK